MVTQTIIYILVHIFIYRLGRRKHARKQTARKIEKKHRKIFTSNVALIHFVCLAVFLLRSFNFCLLYLFTYFVIPYKMMK